MHSKLALSIWVALAFSAGAYAEVRGSVKGGGRRAAGGGQTASGMRAPTDWCFASLNAQRPTAWVSDVTCMPSVGRGRGEWGRVFSKSLMRVVARTFHRR